MILENDAIMPVRKEKLIRSNNTRMKASRNKLVNSSAVPDKAESIGKVNCGKDRPRAQLGLVELI